MLGSSDCGGSGAQTDEQSGQTQTVPVSAGNWSSAVDIGVVFNGSEPGSAAGSSINLLDLVLYVFADDGTLVWNSGSFAPESFASVDPGTGNAGFLYTLDAIQAADFDSVVGPLTSDIRFGLRASLSDADGGVETFFLVNLERSNPTGNVPEPSTILLTAAGLLALATYRRR